LTQKYEDHLQKWHDKQKLAFSAIATINHLWLDKKVELYLFRQSLFNQGPKTLLAHHRYARQIAQREYEIKDTFPVIEMLATLDLAPCRIDVGTLMLKREAAPHEPLMAFLQDELQTFMSQNQHIADARDVVLYGFGRIGRLLARAMIDRSPSARLRLRAVVCRAPLHLEKRVNLLYRDSVHGPFKGNIEWLHDEQAAVINGVRVQFIEANGPSEVDYTAYGIDQALVIDNTGKWRDREGLSQHLLSKGVSKVLLTAPGKGDLPNIVFGVNSGTLSGEEPIVSAASCTTNAIVPVLKVLNDHFSIEHGHIETVHSYTNDQNLLDNFHKKSRRGRSAALNMVITETGAASAVAKALPELTGKISGSAVRVPTPDVSLAILHLSFQQEVPRETINECLRQASLVGPLVAQIDYTRDEEVVSSDMVGNDHPAIVDSLATKSMGKRAVVYVWYDNEFGYTMQVLRLARIVGGVGIPRYQ
jgi:glyceraldehyde 3-phosphate dehydrogenase